MNFHIATEAFYLKVLQNIKGVEDMFARNKDEFADALIAVGYAAMPVMFRLVIPEAKFEVFIRGNSDKFFNALKLLSL
jgi:hypothetical protein